MKDEVFLDIIGWEGLYQVSNIGRVRSLTRKSTSRMIYGKVIKTPLQNSGYPIACLHNNGLNKNELVHRLVAMAFILNPNDKKYVNHKNGVKTDNRVENLEWCTFSENIQHSYDNGSRVITDKHKKRLIKFNTETKSIPLGQYTKKGDLVATYSSGVEAAEKTGFDYSSIMACAKGRYRNHKTCGNHVWKYVESDSNIA